MIKDPIEKIIASLLDDLGLAYIHEMKNKEQRLDFYIPQFDCYIECKAYSTERTGSQIDGKDVILVQGKNAANLLSFLMETGLKARNS